nr:hypothetical protein [uncultured Neokomagataea sp.]
MNKAIYFLLFIETILLVFLNLFKFHPTIRTVYEKKFPNSHAEFKINSEESYFGNEYTMYFFKKNTNGTFYKYNIMIGDNDNYYDGLFKINEKNNSYQIIAEIKNMCGSIYYKFDEFKLVINYKDCP